MECLEELAGYDLVVNCSGLHGARQLFADPSVYPIRGQARISSSAWSLVGWHSQWVMRAPSRGMPLIKGGLSQHGLWLRGRKLVSCSSVPAALLVATQNEP